MFMYVSAFCSEIHGFGVRSLLHVLWKSRTIVFVYVCLISQISTICKTEVVVVFGYLCFE